MNIYFSIQNLYTYMIKKINKDKNMEKKKRNRR